VSVTALAVMGGHDNGIRTQRRGQTDSSTSLLSISVFRPHRMRFIATDAVAWSVCAGLGAWVFVTIQYNTIQNL